MEIFYEDETFPGDFPLERQVQSLVEVITKNSLV